MDTNPGRLLCVECERLLCVGLPDEVVVKFMVYLSELETWNRAFNLTAIKDPGEVVVKHFLDSLTPLNQIKRLGPDEPELLDVGSGAGFPGIPLKIVHPAIRLTSVESRRKKVSFQSYLLGLLKLEARVLHGRVGEVEGAYDFVVGRGFAQPELFVPAAKRLLREGGRIILMLGKKGLDPGSLRALGVNVEARESFELPLDMGSREVLFLRPA